MILLRNIERFVKKSIKQPAYAASVFQKRLKSFISYKLFSGYSMYPEAITLFLTHRCNLRCKMCGQWGESGVTKKMSSQTICEELTLNELKSLIDDIRSFRPNITLFGGEPLLYPDCMDLLRYIKKSNMHSLMISNGSLLIDFAHALVDSGLDELNVSLDGDKNLHDEMRGMPGLFEKITNGLRELGHVKKEKGCKKPLINLQCTITKYNYKHLKQMLAVAGEVGVDSLTYHNLIFLEKDLIKKQKEFDKILGCSSREWEGFISEPEIDPEVLYNEIKDIKNKRYRFAVDFYPNFSLESLKEYYKKPLCQSSEYRDRCLSPWMTAYIFPDGEIRPCLNFSYSYGNIRKNKFVELWNNDLAIRYRNVLKKNKIFPVCVRCTELYRY